MRDIRGPETLNLQGSRGAFLFKKIVGFFGIQLWYYKGTEKTDGECGSIDMA